MSLVFATWSGLGIASTVLFSILFLKETADFKRVFGLGILLSGILLLNFAA
ncbi:multidrug transporter EmrE-like cation transporter [Alkalicoccobacillus murimartini]|uniref:Multidrug transporter EmrE-like cation transporter n=2 Tax=Alkalicoccobacillus murimartini TaxID=171685 RepID=A0ABT9YGE5_9BACI|nr:multidrug transporter EmrE-like cation transporter [Alkalicoccobacillus murimartini]